MPQLNGGVPLNMSCSLVSEFKGRMREICTGRGVCAERWGLYWMGGLKGKGVGCAEGWAGCGGFLLGVCTDKEDLWA